MKTRATHKNAENLTDYFGCNMQHYQASGRALIYDLFINEILLNLNMTTGAFQIGNPSEQQIRNYWTWLLSIDPDSNNPYNGLFYMRASYKYKHAIEDHSHAQRVNLTGSIPNSVGTQQKPVQIPANVSVFVPVLDTLVHDNYLNSTGTPLTISEMNNLLDKENQSISRGDVRADIERLGDGSGRVSLVSSINNMLSCPSARDTTFPLTTPNGSTLAANLEFPQPEGITVNARAAGLYVLISNIAQGTYHITNFSFGVRDYKAFMDYYIQVV